MYKKEAKLKNETLTKKSTTLCKICTYKHSGAQLLRIEKN